MVEHRHEHWLTTKHILRYLRGTHKYGLRYASNGDVKLQDIQTLTGQGVQWIRRVLLNAASILGSV
jgi:hypothetical protein